MPPARSRLPALDGARGTLAVWIALCHFGVPLLDLFPQNPIFIKPVSTVVLDGYFGNGFFFVLSGFVLSYTYQAGFTTLRASVCLGYLRARVARLFPAYVVTLLLLSAMLVVFHRRAGVIAARRHRRCGDRCSF